MIRAATYCWAGVGFDVRVGPRTSGPGRAPCSRQQLSTKKQEAWEWHPASYTYLRYMLSNECMALRQSGPPCPASLLQRFQAAYRTHHTASRACVRTCHCTATYSLRLKKKINAILGRSTQTNARCKMTKIPFVLY
jgi:hypothetical protein